MQAPANAMADTRRTTLLSLYFLFAVGGAVRPEKAWHTGRQFRRRLGVDIILNHSTICGFPHIFHLLYDLCDVYVYVKLVSYIFPRNKSSSHRALSLIFRY